MPWPVYSERFLASQGTPGGSSYYVPAGHRAVVRSLTVVSYEAVAAVVSLSVAGVVVYQRTFPAQEISVYVELRQVAYQGELLSVWAPGSGFAISVNGYLFRDVTGRTGPPPGAGTKPTPEPPKLVS